MSNFRARVTALLIRWCLYLALIPAILSAGVVGASLELGSSWGEAFRNVRVVATATMETYETHFDLFALSFQILLSLEGEDKPDDLDMIAYVAEIRSKTSELSASIDRTLANYLRQQVERSKARRKQQEKEGDFVAMMQGPTLTSVATSSMIAALIPIILYWILSFLLTRWWLNIRARETVLFHYQRLSDAGEDERALAPNPEDRA